MKILKNKIKMQELFQEYNAKVEEQFKLTFDLFEDLIFMHGTGNEDTQEFYIEIAEYLTKSGHAEILNW